MENKQKTPGAVRSTCAQVLAVSALNWFPINVGLIISMPVIINGALMTDQSGLTFTEEDASWFGGLIYIMQPLGSVICGFLQDILGRKTCFMLICIPQLLAWLLLYFGSSVAALFVASGTLGFTMGFMEAPVMSYISEITEPHLRDLLASVANVSFNVGILVLFFVGDLSALGPVISFLSIAGFTMGFMEAPLMSYISEITEPHLRDLLASVANVSFNVGILVLFFVGAVVDWRTMVLISALGPVIAFLSIALVPDSPAWLVSRDRLKDAHKSLQWLRGWVNPETVQQELDAMISFVQDRQVTVVVPKEYTAVATNEGDVKDKNTPGSGMHMFFHPNIQRPMRLILLYFLAANCASLLPIRPFYIEILDNMDLPMDSLNIMAIGGALTLLGSLTATLVMHRLGIRGLTFLSLNLCVISCLGTGLYLVLDLNLPWIPLTLIFISFYAGPFGVLFIPWILISELFPLRGKGFASGVTAALAYLMMFIITKTYYSLVSMVGVSGVFLIYGVIGLVGFVYLYFTLPETEGIPLDVIQARYSGDGKKRSSVCQVEEETKLRTSRDLAVVL